MSLFITFEGIEGSGKTTQIRYLEAYFKEKGLLVIRTREPGGTPLGERIRRLLLKDSFNISPYAELFLIMAQRSQHMEEIILPALKKGKFVLCDRFIDATVAYQGYGRGIDLNLIRHLNAISTKNVKPHLTFLLDCDVEMSLRRKEKKRAEKRDRFEREEVEFHEKVRKGYLEIAASEPERIHVLQGSKDMGTLREETKRVVEKLLSLHGIS